MMNAWPEYDRIESQLQDAYQSDIQKEKWIDDRAREIIELAPSEPLYFVSGSVNKIIRLAVQSEKCREAYNDFITTIAYDQSEKEWEDNYGWAAQ